MVHALQYPYSKVHTNVNWQGFEDAKIRFYFSLCSFKDHDFKEKNLIGRNKTFQSATNTKTYYYILKFL